MKHRSNASLKGARESDNYTRPMRLKIQPNLLVKFEKRWVYRIIIFSRSRILAYRAKSSDNRYNSSVLSYLGHQSRRVRNKIQSSYQYDGEMASETKTVSSGEPISEEIYHSCGTANNRLPVSGCLANSRSGKIIETAISEGGAKSFPGPKSRCSCSCRTDKFLADGFSNNGQKAANVTVCCPMSRTSINFTTDHVSFFQSEDYISSGTPITRLTGTCASGSDVCIPFVLTPMGYIPLALVSQTYRGLIMRNIPRHEHS